MTVRPGAEPFARDGDDVGIPRRPGRTGNPGRRRATPAGAPGRRPGVREDAYARIPSHALHSMLRGYRTVVADLPAVSQPLLVLRPNEDHVVPASSSALILDRVTPSRAAEVILRDSCHVAKTDSTTNDDAGRIPRRDPHVLEQPAMVGGTR